MAVLLVVLIAFVAVLAIFVQIIYNIFFHPYSKYPGPFFARTCSFYSLWHAYRGDLHLDIRKCHEKYGPCVRYAPNRLVFNTTTALKAVYGQGKNFQKSSGYAPHPYYPAVPNTHNTINKAAHGRKRRVVTQAFSENAIAGSEKYIIHHVQSLCAALIADLPSDDYETWSEPRDMAMWTNYFTLDVISDLTFGRAYNLIGDNDLRWVIDAIVAGNRHIYLRFACPWLFNLSFCNPAKWLFPDMDVERKKFTEISNQYANDRISLMEQGKFKRQDIMSALLAASDPKTGAKLSDAETWSEAHLMIAAGGDTTSTALAAVLFYLARWPQCYNQLAEEIRSTFTSASEIHRGVTLSSCKYLKACIDEALRLAPAAPGALWRSSCTGGAVVDGEFIPAKCEVGICTYALSHSEQYFSEPFAFKPERFLEGTERTDNLDAFAPFSVGPRSCLAKPLAYLELTLCLANLMWNLDFESVNATGEGSPSLGNGRERREEFQIIDMFSSNKHGPVLKFKRRKV